jgi:short-subunit dehydrogenase
MMSKAAIITGASSGIGEACARLFASEGYQVVLAARRMERLQIIADEITARGGYAIAVQTDVARLEDLERLVETTLSAIGRLDVLINCAGIGKLVWFDEQSLEDIQTQLEVNIRGVLWLSRLVVPHMIERGDGHIINICSVAGFVPPPTYSVYGTSKFAVRGFTEALRSELKPLGIHVGIVYPGAVATEFDKQAGVNWETDKTTPKWLLLQPGDVAASVLQVVKRRSPQRVIPRIMHLSIWFNAHLPRLVRLAYRRLFRRDDQGTTAWGQRA